MISIRIACGRCLRGLRRELPGGTNVVVRSALDPMPGIGSALSRWLEIFS